MHWQAPYRHIAWIRARSASSGYWLFQNWCSARHLLRGATLQTTYWRHLSSGCNCSAGATTSSSGSRCYGKTQMPTTSVRP